MRVVIAEDLFLLREGLSRLLTAHGFEITAAVDNGDDLLRALLDQRPDVAVVDVRLPPTFTDEGLRTALEARRRIPGLPVLVLSQYVEQLYARELVADQSGGVGYLLKDRVFSDDQFIEALRRVARGGTVLDREVISKLLGRRAKDEPLGALSPREREVLALMAEGRSNMAIAQAPVRHREGGQQAQHVDLRQARPGPVRRRQPPRPRRADLPQLVTGARPG